MNNFRKYLIVVLGVSLLTGCMDKFHEICVVNNAPHPITIYFATNQVNSKTAYPDTSLPVTEPYLINGSISSTSCYRSNKTQEMTFDLLPADTLSVFVINKDTLLYYGWDTIRSQYKILKRYDLSYHDLESMNWRIPYP
jgi:hypothetical protein